MARRIASPASPRAYGGAPGHAPVGMLGGVKQAVGSAPGRKPLMLGDEMYLWILVLLEVGAVFWGRSALSRYHGG